MGHLHLFILYTLNSTCRKFSWSSQCLASHSLSSCWDLWSYVLPCWCKVHWTRLVYMIRKLTHVFNLPLVLLWSKIENRTHLLKCNLLKWIRTVLSNIVHIKIHLISPGCPLLGTALLVQNRGLKHHSFLLHYCSYHWIYILQHTMLLCNIQCNQYEAFCTLVSSICKWK